MGHEVRPVTVYVDTLFLINGLVDYLLLLLTGRVLGIRLCRWRMAVAAALGGGYAVCCFLPGGTGLTLWPVKLGWGFLLVLVSYGGQRRLLRCYGVFLGLSCALGGGLFALELLGGQLSLERGVVLTPLDLKAVLLWSAVCWCVLQLAFRGVAKYSRLRGELIPLTITYRGRSIQISALVDTGNGLRDPATGRGVVILEWQQALGLIPTLREEQVTHPARGLEEDTSVAWRLIPYRAVGTQGGLLLAFAPDSITWAGKPRGETLVALTAQPLPEGTSALVGPE
jgi:stage II sporulation protein GA (sporulation sigma-E factor processing peptidase)